MITQSIDLNLIPGGVMPRFNVSQYDKGSRTLQFNLFNGSSDFVIPSGCVVTIQGTKADKTGFQYDAEYTDNIVTADLKQQMTVFAGEVLCELRIISGSSEILGTANFIIAVEESALADDTVISDTDLPLIEKAIEAAAKAEGSAEDAEAWANGTRGGVPVGTSDPTYQKNAKYYADNFIGMITDAQWSDIESILST